MSKLRGAIVGFGNIAERGHWPSYAASDTVEIIAVVDPSPERQQSAVTLKPDVRGYATLEHLLANETLDFVDICTPPSTHVELAKGCLQRGLHVLCEKPLSLHAADYELLAKQLKKSGKTVFTVHNWKYAPIYQKAFEIIRQGRIGSVWHVEIFTLRNNVCKGTAQGAASPPAPLPQGDHGAHTSSYSAPSPASLREGGRRPGEAKSEDWRTNRGIAGGGILVDHGWHSFYLLLNLVNADPERILAKMLVSREDPDALEEAVQTLVQFPEADGYIHLTWKAKMRRNNAIIQGDKGTLLLDDDRLMLTTYQGEREEIQFDAPLSAGSHHADWFKALLPDFVEEIQNPAKRGRNFREAGWCVALTSGAYESNLRGFQEVAVRFPGTVKEEPALA